MTRFIAAFTIVLAISASAIGISRLIHSDPEHVRPPHTARPDLAGVPTGPIPFELADTNPGEVIEQLNRIAYAAAIGEAQQHEAEAATQASSIRAAAPTGVSNVAPTGSPAPPAPAGDGGCQYADQIRAAWADTPDGDTMIRIAMRESHYTADAYNPSGASGIFQLLGHQNLIDAVCPGGSVFDAACNIAAARLLYDGSGLRPWNF